MVKDNQKVLIILGVVLGVGLLVFGLRSRKTVMKEETVVEKVDRGMVIDLVDNGDGLRKGEDQEFSLVIETGEKPVSGINIIMELDSQYVVFERVEVDESVFNTVMKSEIEGNGSRLLISAVNMKASGELPKGKLIVAKLRLKGVARGSSYLVLLPETYVVGEAGQLGLSLGKGEVGVK